MMASLLHRCLPLWILWTAAASAHPFRTTEHALRSSLSVNGDTLFAVVVLEVPIPDAVAEFATLYPDRSSLGQEQVDAYKKLQWERISAGLTLKVNDQSVDASWAALSSPINGGANEGFFVYMVGSSVTVPVGTPLIVELDNRVLPDVPVMHLSAFAAATSPWVVAENSAEPLLGRRTQVKDVNKDPLGWTRDPALRTLRVVFSRDEIR